MGKKVAREKIKILRDNCLPKEKGFTLGELTVVLFLLGFILLLTFPNFREFFTPHNIKRALLGFTGTIKYTRSQAATTKLFHRLVIDVKENTFWVMREEEKGKFIRDPAPPGQAQNLPEGVYFLDVTTPERGRVEEGPAFIEFSPTGWAEEAAIHLKRKEEEIFTIFVNPLGGKLEIYEGYLERKRE